MKINNEYVKTYLQIVTKWWKTSPLGVKHVNRRPSRTENNSLTQTSVCLKRKNKNPKPIQFGSLLEDSKSTSLITLRWKRNRRPPIGRMKVEYQRHSHDVNRLKQGFNELKVPNYVPLRSHLESRASQLSIIPQSKNNVRWRMMIFFFSALYSGSLPALMSMSVTSWPLNVSLLHLQKQ